MNINTRICKHKHKSPLLFIHHSSPKIDSLERGTVSQYVETILRASQRYI